MADASLSTQQTNGTGGDLSHRWREIMGDNYWAGLLDPMDPVLRSEIIRYGELSQSVHEGFISDIYSIKYGQARYPMASFFNHPLMPKAGYDVTKYIYASSKGDWLIFLDKPVNPDWTQTDVWIGFVAVSDDETTQKLGRRDICIAWRGTVTGTEWAEDVNFLPQNISNYGMSSPDSNVKVHQGFLNLYTQDGDEHSSARKDVLAEVKRLINEEYPNEEVSITVTGHSLGAALALLNGYDIMETGTHVRTSDSKAMHVCMMTFAGPRVGDWSFKRRVEALKMKVLRVVNILDVVPKVPPVDVIFRYTHVGVEFTLNNADSPYLKPSVTSFSLAHNLEGYLHLVDGYQGKGQKFKLATGRDIALVNKQSDFLKDEYHIPPEWRVDENKGMIKNGDNRWVHT